MYSLLVSILSVIFVFSGAMLGMLLQRFLPENHLREDSRDTIKVGAGMIASLSALVLGLLVSSAKNTFDTMSSEITQGAAKIILLDRVLANYGSETKVARQYLREGVEMVVEKVWPSNNSPTYAARVLEHGGSMELVQREMLALKPDSDAKNVLMSQAQLIAIDLRQTRWLLVEQAQSSLPIIFLIILVFWLAMLHVSFGLLAPKNLTVISVMFVSAVSISCSLFLILELSHPLHGLIKVSGAPMRNAIEHLGQE